MIEGDKRVSGGNEHVESKVRLSIVDKHGVVDELLHKDNFAIKSTSSTVLIVVSNGVFDFFIDRSDTRTSMFSDNFTDKDDVEFLLELFVSLAVDSFEEFKFY